MTPQEPEVSPTSTVKVTTPDGTMFVHIMEHTNGAPYKLDLSIGKGGSSVQAWAQALSRVISAALRKGILLSDIAEEVSSITTDKLAFSNNKAVRSGPDGVAQAILQYLASKLPTVVTGKRRRRGPTFREDDDDA